MDLTVETFEGEIIEALKTYDKFIVCLDKTPEDCKATLVSLMDNAIKAYVSRGPHLRHGIALDKQVTIILSQTEQDRPLCGIYFNLHSPYKKKGARQGKKRELMSAKELAMRQSRRNPINTWLQPGEYESKHLRKLFQQFPFSRHH